MHASTLQIRDVPGPVYQRLKRRADLEHRSLSQQALESLELGLMVVENQAERRRELLAAWHGAKRIEWPENLPDPTGLIRQDRDR